MSNNQLSLAKLNKCKTVKRISRSTRSSYLTKATTPKSLGFNLTRTAKVWTRLSGVSYTRCKDTCTCRTSKTQTTRIQINLSSGILISQCKNMTLRMWYYTRKNRRASTISSTRCPRMNKVKCECATENIARPCWRKVELVATRLTSNTSKGRRYPDSMVDNMAGNIHLGIMEERGRTLKIKILVATCLVTTTWVLLRSRWSRFKKVCTTLELCILILHRVKTTTNRFPFSTTSNTRWTSKIQMSQ